MLCLKQSKNKCNTEVAVPPSKDPEGSFEHLHLTGNTKINTTASGDFSSFFFWFNGNQFILYWIYADAIAATTITTTNCMCKFGNCFCCYWNTYCTVLYCIQYYDKRYKMSIFPLAKALIINSVVCITHVQLCVFFFLSSILYYLSIHTNTKQ